MTQELTDSALFREEIKRHGFMIHSQYQHYPKSKHPPLKEKQAPPPVNPVNLSWFSLSEGLLNRLNTGLYHPNFIPRIWNCDLDKAQQVVIPVTGLQVWVVGAEFPCRMVELCGIIVGSELKFNSKDDKPTHVNYYLDDSTSTVVVVGKYSRQISYLSGKEHQEIDAPPELSVGTVVQVTGRPTPPTFLETKPSLALDRLRIVSYTDEAYFHLSVAKDRERVFSKTVNLEELLETHDGATGGQDELPPLSSQATIASNVSPKKKKRVKLPHPSSLEPSMLTLTTFRSYLTYYFSSITLKDKWTSETPETFRKPISIEQLLQSRTLSILSARIARHTYKEESKNNKSMSPLWNRSIITSGLPMLLPPCTNIDKKRCPVLSDVFIDGEEARELEGSALEIAKRSLLSRALLKMSQAGEIVLAVQEDWDRWETRDELHIKEPHREESQFTIGQTTCIEPGSTSNTILTNGAPWPILCDQKTKLKRPILSQELVRKKRHFPLDPLYDNSTPKAKKRDESFDKTPTKAPSQHQESYLFVDCELLMDIIHKQLKSASRRESLSESKIRQRIAQDSRWENVAKWNPGFGNALVQLYEQGFIKQVHGEWIIKL